MHKMTRTLLVEVKHQLGALVPGWVTVWHVLLFNKWIMVWTFLECQLQTKFDTVDSKRVCANCVGCVSWWQHWSFVLVYSADFLSKLRALFSDSFCSHVFFGMSRVSHRFWFSASSSLNLKIDIGLISLVEECELGTSKFDISELGMNFLLIVT